MMRKMFFALLMVLTVLSAVNADGVTTIKAPGKVHITGTEVLLGDIAEITGNDSDAVARIKAVLISRAPRPGQYVRVSRSSIARKLARSGFSPDEFRLDTPLTISIYTPQKKITSQEIIDSAIEFIKKEKMADSPETLTVVLRPTHLYAPGGKITYECRDAGGTSPLIISIQVDILCDGKQVAYRKVNFKSASRLGTPEDGDSKSEKNSNIDKSGKGEPSADEEDVGEQERSVPAISRGQKVKAGDMLEVTIVKKNLTITSMGIARQNGNAGDRIRIQLDSSRKIIKALLLDSKRAYIEMP